MIKKNLNKKTVLKKKDKSLDNIKEIEIQEKKEKELQELDRIAKMLIRRDLELTELREKKEKEFQELKEKTKELENTRKALINMLEDVKDSKEALMNILEDIEEARKEANDERNKTLSIITNFTDGLLVFDKKNNLFLINPRAEDFFSVKAEELMGNSILDLAKNPVFKPLTDLLEKFFQFLQNKNQKDKKIEEIFRKEIKLKEKLILEASAVPMLRKKEKVGTLVILHNITREKMVEKMKTEFVSIAAHQLRTPLSAIKWTLRMLLDGDLGKITEEQREFIKKTYKSNERMINLINDLLNVARIEEGRFLYKPVLIQFEDIIQEVISSYAEVVKKKEIIIEFIKPKRKLPLIMLDVEKIKLAIQNLLDNSVRYTPVGGKLIISVSRNKKKIEFSIKDNGMGIPKDQQERIFSKFFRATNVTKMDTEGSGLGLFIINNIIEAHGGKIWFKSKEGKGTIFYFSLPIKK